MILINLLYLNIKNRIVHLLKFSCEIVPKRETIIQNSKFEGRKTAYNIVYTSLVIVTAFAKITRDVKKKVFNPLKYTQKYPHKKREPYQLSCIQSFNATFLWSCGECSLRSRSPCSHPAIPHHIASQWSFCFHSQMLEQAPHSL